MLNIQKVDHLGIRVSDKDRAIDFYGGLGFQLVADAGFDQGHPVIMRHPSGVVVNLLGPATKRDVGNILMDVEEKYPGYTHVALRIDSLVDARNFLEQRGIAITGGFTYKNMTAIFIRDPDRNVIELDAYSGDEPVATTETLTDDFSGFSSHP